MGVFQKFFQEFLNYVYQIATIPASKDIGDISLSAQSYGKNS